MIVIVFACFFCFQFQSKDLIVTFSYMLQGNYSVPPQASLHLLYGDNNSSSTLQKGYKNDIIWRHVVNSKAARDTILDLLSAYINLLSLTKMFSPLLFLPYCISSQKIIGCVTQVLHGSTYMSYLKQSNSKARRVVTKIQAKGEMGSY